MPPKLGCIIRSEVRALHASLATEAVLKYPAWSRVEGAPRILGHNDQIGDCACVAAVMAVQTQLSRQGIMTPMPDDLPVQIYSAITGYVPGNAATDQGTDPEQLFAWWAANPIAGYKLGTFTRINPANVNAMRNAIINGGAYLCVELAVEQQGQKEWKPAGTPGSWGGHAVWADTYEADWLSVTSWGECILVDDAYLSGGFGAAVFSLDLEAT